MVFGIRWCVQFGGCRLEELYSGSQDAEVLVWSPRIDWAGRATAGTPLAPEAQEITAATAADNWSDDDDD